MMYTKHLWMFVSILVLVSPVYAHMETESVDSIMNRMMTNQGVNDINKIECGKISDHEFEELGDAVMDRMLNDIELHERMDNMMGGEGSESLRQMHIAMGKSWSDCGGTSMGMFMPMMGGMMNPYGYSDTTAQVSLVLSIISLVAVVIGGFVIFNKLNKLVKTSKRK